MIDQKLPEPLRRNIEHVLKVESHASRAKGLTEAFSDRVGRFVGTITFAVLHLAMFGGWIAWNSGAIAGMRIVDPYPFNLLSTFGSCEAVILAAFVLMTQNRMSALADRRDHLDLQVNLAVEQETSMIIQMLDRISRKLEIPAEERETALQLSRTSMLERLVEELHERLPHSQGELPKAEDC